MHIMVLLELFHVCDIYCKVTKIRITRIFFLYLEVICFGYKPEKNRSTISFLHNNMKVVPSGEEITDCR